jgi:hypothetical protein
MNNDAFIYHLFTIKWQQIFSFLSGTIALSVILHAKKTVTRKYITTVVKKMLSCCRVNFFFQFCNGTAAFI